MKKEKQKRGKQIVASVLSGLLLVNSAAPLAAALVPEQDASSVLIEAADIPLRLQYDEEAPYGNEDAWTTNTAQDPTFAYSDDDGWERWSLPLGNGYFGVNAFGRTETERLQITEKTLSNPYYTAVEGNGSPSLGGLNNFSETYIDFGHTNSEVTSYLRALDLKTAISTVSYEYDGVTYTREYFTSYPDKALVIRLDASEAGKLSFTLRPTVPYEQDYAVADAKGDYASKHGTVVASAENGVGEIRLFGNMGYYDIDFEACYRVMTDGSGTVSAANGTDEDGQTDNGTVTVSGAKSAVILVTLGTNYELNSNVFTASRENKIPDTNRSAHDKVTEEMQAILDRNTGKTLDALYADVKEKHVADHSELFGRVSLDLATDPAEYEMMTDELLAAYQAGTAGSYLEVLYFQYGRYLLIASSREGTLPSSLQGTWNRYNFSPWGSGIWHNINVQMNYWPAFSTNLAETFEAYVGYNKAYMAAAQQNATSIISSKFKDKLGADGGNGWCLGNGFPYSIAGNDSAGNLGFMTELYWDYYLYTQDNDLLAETVYPTLADAARFITKIMTVDEDGNYLVANCDSPEQFVNGVWYYTEGTTYAQTFAYTNNYHTLLAAEILGKTGEDDSILTTIAEQLDKYDPIKIGYSGQLKEFREEDYYGDLGEWKHRHISQLVGLYPGYIVNDTTPAWLDAAIYSLTERGLDISTGWGLAHRLNLWARTGDGNQAYTVYQNLLSKRTATNLWDLHPPFQIDGNFGGTAGVAEMLLQSQAGYIEPLAAIPDAWESGSYTGLVARGNFVVGAAWENGVAKTLNIESRAGGTCRVSYSGIGDANVRTASGRKVSYTRESGDLISFETVAGETYIISSMKEKGYSAPVSALAITEETYGTTTLAWSTVSGAVSYNIYTAVEDAPTYTYLESTTKNTYTVTAESGEENARTTFCVTAVGADGTESERTLVYRNPHDPAAVEDATLVRLEDGSLQATVQTVGEAARYTLYRKTAGESDYTALVSSEYPVLVSSDGYAEGASYAVSVTCAYTKETSELFLIKQIESACASDVGYSENIFKNSDGTYKEFKGDDSLCVPGTTDPERSYVYKNLADGSSDNRTGRLALASASTPMIAEVDLGGIYLLDAMRVFDYADAGDKTRADDCTVEVYADGVWTAVVSSQPLKEETGSGHTGGADEYTEWKLSYVKAEKIRLTFKNNTGNNKAISVCEITCSGVKLADLYSEEENIFAGKVFTGDDSACVSSANGVYGYARLTDGSTHIHTGRFALPDKANSTMIAEMDLEEVYRLGTITVYDFANADETTRANDCTIEVYYMGAWHTVLSGVSLDETEGTMHAGSASTAWDLGGVKAERIRLTFKNTTGNNKGVSLYEITCSGRRTGEKTDGNILAGLTSDSLSVSGATVNTTYPLTNAFDGNTSTRYAINDVYNTPYTLTMTLGEKTPLHTLRIYDFRDGSDKVNGAAATRSDKTTVEILLDGVWYTLIREEPMTVSAPYTEFDLGGAVGEAIRITFNHTVAFDTYGTRARASIYEITCTTSSSANDRTGVLAALKTLDAYLAAGEREELLVPAARHAETARAEIGMSYLSDERCEALQTVLSAWNAAFAGESTYAFLAEGADGSCRFYESEGTAAADGALLCATMQALAQSVTVTLLSDLRWESGNVSWVYTSGSTSGPMTGKTFALDLNGMTLTIGAGVTGAWITHNCKMTAAHYYSSRPGGEIKGEGTALTAFAQGQNSPVTVGRYELDGEEIAGDNLTVSNLRLCSPWSSSFTVDGGTYTHAAGSTGSVLDVATGNIIVKNATFLSYNNVPLINFSSSATGSVRIENSVFLSTYEKDLIGGWKDKTPAVTLCNSSFYGYTLNAAGRLTTEKENLFTAVSDSLTDKTVARIGERSSTLLPSAPALRYSVLSASSDASLVTWDYGDGSTVSELWRVGELPKNGDTRAIGDASDFFYRFRATERVKKGEPMTVAMEVASGKAKVRGNLTLYSDITFNLYFANDGMISGVRYNGVTTLFDSDSAVTLDGASYYTLSIDDIPPKELYESFALDILLTSGDVYTVKTSLAKYATAVLENEEETEAGKTLVLSLIDYVRELAVTLGGASTEHAGIKAIDALLTRYAYTRPTWKDSEAVATPTAGNIVAASLNLTSEPGFAFTLSEDYRDTAEVTLTVNGKQKVCTVEKREDNGNPYVLIGGIHASRYRDPITVTLNGQEFVYSLDVYMRGFGESVPAYAEALYAYSVAAERYLEVQKHA